MIILYKHKYYVEIILTISLFAWQLANFPLNSKWIMPFCPGFVCPFVPLLPIACILINVYLLINLGWVFYVLFMSFDVFANGCIPPPTPPHGFHCLIFMCSAATWARVSVWLLIGIIVYIFYGRTHSKLHDAVYVPAAHLDEIYRNSDFSLA